MENYVTTAGQTYLPYTENTNISFQTYNRCGIPEPALPEIKIRPELAENWIVTCDSQHFIPGITAEMLDWFWGNMEKCYYLWAPGTHKLFKWIMPPWKSGLVGSSCIFVEQETKDGPLKVLSEEQPATTLGMNEFVFDQCLEHVIIQGVSNTFINVHMWQTAQGGCIHRMSAAANMKEAEHFPIPIEPGPIISNSLEHPEYEAATWPKFLPQLYALWADHPDPSQSIRWNLAVKKTGKFKWEYIHKNGPITKE